MICPKCKELGQKSTIHGGMGMVTCAYYPPYYDEEGIFHSHDGNLHSSINTCSKGHRITAVSTGKCPNYNWGHDSEKITVEDMEPQTVTTINGGGLVKFP